MDLGGKGLGEMVAKFDLKTFIRYDKVNGKKFLKFYNYIRKMILKDLDGKSTENILYDLD